MSTQYGERIAKLEERVHGLAKQQTEMNAKLDELLVLRNKGMGAFWLASIIVGTGLVGFVMQAIGWIRGH
jgi:hypothetical protein